MRIWETNHIYGEPERVYIAKSDIPISDLDGVEYNDDTISMVYIPGLAYQIPMSKSEASKHIYPVGDDVFPSPNARPLGVINEFNGTVSGRLVTRYTNDLGVEVMMPLRGLYIELRDHDFADSEVISSAHADRDGRFVMDYSVNQNFTEGSNMELFVTYYAEHLERDIEVLNRTFFGKVFRNNAEIGDAGDDFVRDLGEIEANHDGYKSAHWANRGWDFCLANGINMVPGLRIFHTEETFGNSFFFPFGLLGFNLPTTKPSIILETNGQGNEGTTYHEFGHFVMFMAQGSRYVIPNYNNAGGTHRSTEENTSNCALNEGWATIIESVLDAVYREDDNEFGYDVNIVNRPDYERRRRFTQFNNTGRINNGFRSEYYFSAAVYDLWDGSDKNLLNENFSDTDIHNYIDNRGATNNDWMEEDDVSLPFSVLLAPLRGVFLPRTSHDYYERLMNLYSNDCEMRANIARIFRENRVVFDITRYERGFPLNNAAHNTGWASSGLRRNVSDFNNAVVLQLGTDASYTDVYDIAYSGDESFTYNTPSNFEFWTDYTLIDQLSAADEFPVFNVNTGTEGVQESSIEVCNTLVELRSGQMNVGSTTRKVEMTIRDRAELRVNRNDSEFNLEGESSIVVKDGGLLSLYLSANLILKGKSKIIVESGGTLFISGSSTIEFLEESQLIIEPNAYVCIQGRNNLVFSSDIENHLSYQQYNVGVNPALDLMSTNCTELDDIVQYDYNVVIQEVQTPTCVNTAFNFQIQGDLPQDTKFCWSLPSHWLSVNPNCERWSRTMSGTSNNWQSGNFKGGNVEVKISSRLGVQVLTIQIPDGVLPTISSNYSNEIFICQEGDDPVLIVQADENVNFNWTNHWNLNHKLRATSNKSLMTLYSNQWHKEAQTMQVNASSIPGCVSNTLEFTIVPGNSTWEAGYLSPDQMKTLLNDKNNNVVADRFSRVFFTSEDNKIYYYEWNYTTQFWEISSPLVQNSNGSLVISDNPSYIRYYYIGTDNGIWYFDYNRTSYTWSTPVIVNDVAKNAKYGLVERVGDFYYVNQQNKMELLKQNGSFTKLSNDDVSGASIVVDSENLLFITTSGKIAHVQNNDVSTLRYIPSQANSNSDLIIDSEKNIYYVDYSGLVYRSNYLGLNYSNPVNLNYGIGGSDKWMGANGKLTINKTSDVIYYTGYNNRIYQLFNNNLNVWESKITTQGLYNNTGAAAGKMIYHFPHVFFVSANRMIGNLFYFENNGCYSVVQRKGDLNDQLFTEIVVSPNPAFDFINIVLNVEEVGVYRSVISNLNGIVFVEGNDESYFELGENKLRIDISALSLGVYILELEYPNGIVKKTKFVKTK